jgi:putative membrane protein
MKSGFRQSLTHFAQGLLMGAADIIPGVSGGTMALIVGIYSRLISALSDLFSTVVSLAKFDITDARERLRHVEWSLLIPLGLGIVTALIIGARFIPDLMERYPHESLGLFFGLVAGSIVIPWKRIDRKTGLVIVVSTGAAVISFLLTGFPPQSAGEPSLLRVFVTAAIAICAMILPGVSGAFLLKVLGMYEVTLAAVNARDILYVATFVLGAGVGIGLFSKLLNWLLSNWYDVTMAALVGLMVGAIRALWPWQDADRSLLLPNSGVPVWSVVLLGLAGLAFVLLLALWSDKIEDALEQTG